MKILYFKSSSFIKLKPTVFFNKIYKIFKNTVTTSLTEIITEFGSRAH